MFLNCLIFKNYVFFSLGHAADKHVLEVYSSPKKTLQESETTL